MNKTNVLEGDNQTIFITGSKGIGKTNLAATFLPPDRVGELYLVDSENSSNNFLNQLVENKLSVGHYLNMTDRFSNLPADKDMLNRISVGQLPWVTAKERQGLIDYYLSFVEHLQETLKPDKYSVVVVDTIEKLEAGMGAWVDKNKRLAGVDSVAYGKLWSEGVFPLYEALISGIHNRGVKTVILTSHLKTPWEDNRPVVGKVVPAGKKILYTLSKLCIWLVRDTANYDGAPAGLILKERYAKIGVENGEWVIKKMIPPRIPHCTWKDIRNYVENGVDMQNLSPREKLSQDELTLVEEMTTDKQLQLMILDAQKELEVMRQTNTPFLPSSAEPVVVVTQPAEDLVMAVKEVKNANPAFSAMQIKDAVSEKLGRDVNLPEIIKALKS